MRKVDLAIELQILSFHEHRKASALPATGVVRADRGAGGLGTAAEEAVGA